MGAIARRSNADKWRAVMGLLADPSQRGKSDRWLAGLAGVSPGLVGKVRRVSDGPAGDVRRGKDGRAVRTPPRPPATPAPVLTVRADSENPSPAVAEVLAGRRPWAVEVADCLPFLDSLPEGAVDLVMGSPPYLDARTYGRGDVARDPIAWVEWLLDVTVAAVRSCSGLVLWVCAGVTRDGCYWPAPEGLVWEWWKRGNQLWRPAVWHKTRALPGTGGEQQLRNCWEYVLAFKRVGPLPWADPLACGATPSRGRGLVDGTVPARRPDGERYARRRPSHGTGGPAVANPGNVVACPAGGRSSAGRRAAADSEAPCPEALVEFFVRTYGRPGGVVCDPFAGSGTTGAVAVRLGRRFVGCDLRPDQVGRARERIKDADSHRSAKYGGPHSPHHPRGR